MKSTSCCAPSDARGFSSSLVLLLSFCWTLSPGEDKLGLQVCESGPWWTEPTESPAPASWNATDFTALMMCFPDWSDWIFCLILFFSLALDLRSLCQRKDGLDTSIMFKNISTVSSQNHQNLRDDDLVRNSLSCSLWASVISMIGENKLLQDVPPTFRASSLKNKAVVPFKPGKQIWSC